MYVNQLEPLENYIAFLNWRENREGFPYLEESIFYQELTPIFDEIIRPMLFGNGLISDLKECNPEYIFDNIAYLKYDIKSALMQDFEISVQEYDNELREFIEKFSI